MNNIKVSIILPTYNVGKYITQCLDSVLNQTYKNIEVIIVDDGSTDNSGVIADNYASKDNRVIVAHQQNAGVSTARNIGIANATGDYICFADPDDILCNDYVEYMLNLCLKYQTNIAVCAEVFTPTLRFQKNDNITVVSGEEAASYILYGKITVGCYSKMFNREFLIKNDIKFLSDVYIGEGFNFNVTTFCIADKIVISQHKVYHYRVDNSSSAMTQFNVEKCKMAIQAISIIRDNLIIKSGQLYKAVDYAEWTTYGSMYDWIVMAGAKDKYPELYKQYLKFVHQNSFKFLFAPTTFKRRISSFIKMIHPYIWAYIRHLSRRRKQN